MSALEPAVEPAAVLEALQDTLSDPVVRDLAWLLGSRPLLRGHPPAGELAAVFETAHEMAATVDWLLALERDPSDLRQALAVPRIVRLGRYAECLLGYFLEHGPACRLVAANVALRLAGRTIGECDFLMETASGHRLHWELAVKCYLHAGGERAELADYVGPNLQDRFDLKLAHLLGHQLPLSAREEFAALGHAGPWQPQMFVKGWLFYRWGETPPVAPALDPAHHRGFWVTRGDWPAFCARRPAARWVVLPRLAWLAPRPAVADEAVDAAGLSTVGALGERLAQHTGPTMVAAFEREPAGLGRWRETERGFLVPDEWPDEARAYALGDA
ncbi:DUF1853 family protein [Trinickia dinghuensis]|uniref:DUF1853 family protein n=1 Tax=Trinickia dinghuensis TaxID=2291023 RepID=A0A3D8K2J5_9BURK|nr:DUF1853 family protein [Trinickia dinghuensis]RDU99538.1 DUF1853 family protein [Trinickia dinghuensis]